jgi:hypothetical protein
MVKNEQLYKAVSQYDKRLRDTHRRLCNALERLIAARSNDPAQQKTQNRFTVATLAREAGVGRNAIYNNHRALLDQLRQAALTVSPKAAQREDRLVEQRMTIEALKLNERRMITENAVLLKRALDSEAQADRHCKQNARLIAERDAGLRPVSIASKKRR